MSNFKTIKKGDLLFKEGDKISSLFLIQSGGVQLALQRPKKNIDLATLGAPQVLGELGLLGMSSFPYSGIATAETKYMEFPLENAKAQLDGAPQFLKVLIRSALDRIKQATNDIKSSRMEKDSSPCPEDQVAKIFGTIFHTFRHKGLADEKEKNKTIIDWTLAKQYAQRVFSESPKRFEQAISVLVKMKIAQFIMGKAPDNPEGPDEIQKVHLFDLSAVESFFEFYQYHYFKGGKSDILKPDDTAYNLLSHFLKISEGVELDRYGVISLDYTKVLEIFKTEFSLNLNSGHFTMLEGRGIFAKRASRQDGSVALQFELKEWQTTHKIWRILREIEKWNEKGFVDMTEEEAKAKKKSESSCPQCSVQLAAGAKFCQECGFKIAA
jgi:CRP-like cAMP-binding protein